jgi:phthiodiolone/phenolphthiodiolone dimycocerosates ketoreductase
MVARKIAIGLQIGTQPPLRTTELFVLAARLMRLDSIMAIDHFQNVFPTAIWTPEFSWIAAERQTPHEHFDFQVFLGHLAARAGRMRLGVGVTDPIRRHPVVIAQAMLTLSHLTKRAPILGLGAGERMNIDPYGLDMSHSADRLEEALKIIRLCFYSRGAIDFTGAYYQLERARLDLKAPPGKTPEIWIGAHGPRMLRLTGMYADGWYPTMITSPTEYANKLAMIYAAAREAGRNPEKITPALHRFAVIGRTEQETEAMLDSKAIRAFALAAPAELWRNVGREHPLGAGFRGYVDIIPERYDRRTIEAAIAAVPRELVRDGPLLWGTPEQVARKIQKFGDAGLRHIVIAPVSGLVSKQAAVYSLRALYEIKRLLRKAP